MNHSIKFNAEYEILGKKKKKFSSEITAHDIEIDIIDREMVIAKHKTPFKSFVKNFAVALAKIFGNSATSSESLKYASGTATTGYLATNFLCVSEGALSASRARRGIFIGDKEANSYNGASIGSIKTGTSPTLHVITGQVQNQVQKSDVFLKRRLEANTASCTSGIYYGANSITIENDTTVKIVRRFRNNSGKTIKINEIGLGSGKPSMPISGIVLLARDIMAYDISVLNGQYIDITYRFTVGNGLTTNFAVLLANLFSGTLSGKYYVNGNGSSDTITNTNYFSIDRAAGADSYGITIGSGDNSRPSIYDKSLENQWSHGTIEPYFAYSDTSPINELNTSNSTSRFGFYRDFTCKGTTTKEVNEGGIALQGDSTKPIYIARFAINGMRLNPEDILRVSIYFDFPVSSTLYVTQEA